MSDIQAFVGLDVHKETISIAVADAGRDSEVRFLGEIANTPEAVAKLARKLRRQHGSRSRLYLPDLCGSYAGIWVMTV